jgi:hypothetical protein
MRRFAFIAPLAATLAFAAATQAEPARQPVPAPPVVSVSIGGDLVKNIDKLGQRDVDLQLADLTRSVERSLARSGALPGAQVNLVVTDLKPNRPTMQQTIDRPGLSMQDSISIGGATIEGEVVTADGQRLPVRYSRYSTSLAEVYGHTTWSDADTAFDRLAGNLARGRLFTR